jgi:hypothetical protein
VNVKVISVNDTQYYNIQPEDRADIVSIHTVYMYTPEVGVYLCELRPSHELHYLYTYLVTADNVESDRADELDNRYCHEGGDDTYQHCDSALLKTAKDCGEFDDMEAAREYLQGNCPF